MCGIFCIYKSTGFVLHSKDEMNNYIRNAKLMEHRGNNKADTSRMINNKVLLYHNQLSLDQDILQPIIKNNIMVMMDGEISNYNDLYLLIQKNLSSYVFKSQSNAEILIPLYILYGSAFISKLRGLFSFILYDSIKKILIAARDHIGAISLYYSIDNNKSEDIIISSEMKTLLNLSKNIKMFNPGQVYINGEFFTHYMPLWKTIDHVPNGKLVYKEIKDKLIDSITSQILNDKPLGILLSGGFNSSILTIILHNLKMKGIIKNELNTFTIGLESNNIPHTTEAEKLSELLNIEHNVYNYTIEDVMDILEDLIYYLEVYDVTTIRSAIPYYLLSMQIQEDPEIKQVISGDIANELFINNSNILPSCSTQKNNIKKDKLQKDIVSNISNIYNTTLLRSHKTTMACSLKSILPFGDRDLIDYIMNIDPKYKMTNKESILKKTFYDECNEINYNVDELQSISLSKNDLLINELISNIDNIITDDEFNNKSKIIATTKEEYYYKKIYNKYYVLE